jgi:4-amino-4-deoxy-L-arabinose transferase-like glycosyltransferase
MVRAYSVDRRTIYFLAVLMLYIAFQIACTANVFAYLPDGFRTENMYHILAQNLMSYGSYALGEPPALEPSTFRPPLYAFVLSLAYLIFGAQEIVGVVMNNVFLTATLVLVYLIGRRINPGIGLLAVVLLMLDTIFLAQANRNQSDLLFCFLLTLSTWCFLNSFSARRHAVWLIIGCFALALAVFTRAAAMYLWLPVSISLIIAFWQRLPVRHIVMFVAAVIIIQGAFVVPWMMRNHALTGNSDYAGMKGFHLTSFWAPLLVGKRLGVSPLKAKKMISDNTQSDPALPNSEDQGRYEAYMVARGQQLILDNAAYILPVLLDNIPRMFLSYASEPLVVFLSPQRFDAWQGIDKRLDKISFGTSPWDVERRIALLRTFWDDGLISVLGYGFIVKFVNSVIFVMAFVGIWLMVRGGSRQWRDTAWFIFLVYGCIALISLLATQGRFRVPVMPAFALTASFALQYMWQNYGKQWRLRKRVQTSN